MDLSERSDKLRRHILVPAGGWLGEIVVILSDLTGVWDLLYLCAIFVGAWILLRTSAMEISMILGHIFDLTIPLQHQNNPTQHRRHAKHLEDYWPLFIIGSLVEVACFFLLHPDLFTLCVCLKTTVMTVIWMGRMEDGTWLTSALRGGPSHGGGWGGDGGPPSGGGDRGPSEPHRDRSRDDNPRDRGDNSRRDPAESSNPSKSNETPEETKKRKARERDDKWDKKLKDAGYGPEEARKGMVNELKKLGKDKDKQAAQLKKWLDETDKDHKRTKSHQYMDQYQKDKQAGLTSESGRTVSSFLPEAELEKVKSSLKKAGYPKDVIPVMLDRLKRCKDQQKVDEYTKKWFAEPLADTVKANTQAYRMTPPVGPDGKSALPRGKLDEKEVNDCYARLMKQEYPREVAINMVKHLSKLDKASAKKRVAQWTKKTTGIGNGDTSEEAMVERILIYSGKVDYNEEWSEQFRKTLVDEFGIPGSTIGRAMAFDRYVDGSTGKQRDEAGKEAVQQSWKKMSPAQIVAKYTPIWQQLIKAAHMEDRIS